VDRRRLSQGASGRPDSKRVAKAVGAEIPWHKVGDLAVWSTAGDALKGLRDAVVGVDTLHFRSGQERRDRTLGTTAPHLPPLAGTKPFIRSDAPIVSPRFSFSV